MSETAGRSEETNVSERDRALTRVDAVASRERILDAAAALVGDRRMSMSEVAAAAGVGRSTLYRHSRAAKRSSTLSNSAQANLSRATPCRPGG
ncbi:MAG: helix-turn-helix transcriptional regulator [Actinobacteria bacterium]|nr:helix-turn-helix transcriptional regulator [Actinomycetota bacterium]